MFYFLNNRGLANINLPITRPYCICLNIFSPIVAVTVIFTIPNLRTIDLTPVHTSCSSSTPSVSILPFAFTFILLINLNNPP